MAGIIDLGGQSGRTIYFVIRNTAGQVWNGAAFEAFNASNWANYDVAATEQGTSGTDIFSADQAADTNQEIETSFSNATIDAGDWFTFTTGSSAASGACEQIFITVYYTEDVQ